MENFETRRNIIVKGEARNKDILKEVNAAFESTRNGEFLDLLIPMNFSGDKVNTSFTMIFDKPTEEIVKYKYYATETRTSQLTNRICSELKCSAEYVKAIQIGNKKWLLIFRKPTEEYINAMARYGD